MGTAILSTIPAPCSPSGSRQSLQSGVLYSGGKARFRVLSRLETPNLGRISPIAHRDRAAIDARARRIVAGCEGRLETGARYDSDYELHSEAGQHRAAERGEAQCYNHPIMPSQSTPTPESALIEDYIRQRAPSIHELQCRKRLDGGYEVWFRLSPASSATQSIISRDDYESAAWKTIVRHALEDANLE